MKCLLFVFNFPNNKKKGFTAITGLKDEFLINHSVPNFSSIMNKNPKKLWLCAAPYYLWFMETKIVKPSRRLFCS